MNPWAFIMMISSLILGTLITLTGYHWMLTWAGLEINTLAIMPLMMKKPHPRAIEAATKYFLTQAAASALILFSATTNAWMTGEWAINTTMDNTSSILITIALAMKLGVAPFHLWLPEVLQGLTLQTGLILLTWQKLAPMTLMIQLSQSVNLNLMLIMGLLSTILGGWGGINQTQIRKMLAFSSTAHLGWMMTILKIYPQLTMLNFIVYTFITSTLLYMFMYLKTKNISEVSTSWSKNPVLSSFSLLSILSLGGLPPFTGFSPKWLIIQELVNQGLTFFSLIIMLSTLLSLFFYLRLIYAMSITLSPNTTNSVTTWLNPTKTWTAAPIIFTLTLLPILPTYISIM
uniref:NADH-ubiquinone oxidoreductase chain 2 n=1 Tax=Cryptobatrachus sp. TNHC-GDC 451 TaxID=1338817 RepID=S4V0H4_9NEOB|nr:NADH dehydrogenase subunit 2 [Cryptobatrachus sp. TNHC-GDC 451]